MYYTLHYIIQYFCPHCLACVHLRRGAGLQLRQRSGKFSYSRVGLRSEEHTSELQSLMRISYAVFCLKKKIQPKTKSTQAHTAGHKPNIKFRPHSTARATYQKKIRIKT